MSDITERSDAMKKIFTIGIRLTIICAVASFLLGLVNAVTAPIITERRQQDFTAAISEVAGGGTVGERIAVDEGAVELYFPITGANGALTGYVVQLLESGYGGDLRLLAAFTPDGTITSVKLIENSETPGLGKKAEEPAYMKKYLGTGGTSAVPVAKNQLEAAEADAITGATVTFGAIGRALESGSAFVQTRGGK